MSDRVAIDRDGGLAEVRLTRADKHNGVDYPMFEALHAALDELEADESLRAVVLHGEGPSFCAGLDIKSFAGQDIAEKVVAKFDPDNPANFAQRAAYGWRQLPVPVVAALHGAVFGAGAQMALAADIRIAAPDTRFSIMEMKYGLIPDMGLSQLVRGLRDDVVRELIYTARVVEAEEAAELGLVTRVSDNGLDDARALASQIAAQPERAVRAAKRRLQEMPRLSEAEGLALEEELQRQMLGVPAPS